MPTGVKKPSVKEERLAVLIRTLMAAEANIQLAKKMIKDIYGSKGALLVSSMSKTVPLNVDIKDVPGVEGVFKGKFMEGADGKKYQVPENYASKSELVYGDRLKVIEREEGNWFKQVTKVDRKEITGILAKSGEDGWKLVVEDSSYDLLPAAVSFYKCQEGQEVYGLIPANVSGATFATFKGLVKDTPIIKEPDEKAPVKNEPIKEPDQKTPIKNVEVPPEKSAKKTEPAAAKKEDTKTKAEPLVVKDKPSKKSDPASAREAAASVVEAAPTVAAPLSAAPDDEKAVFNKKSLPDDDELR